MLQPPAKEEVASVQVLLLQRNPLLARNPMSVRNLFDRSVAEQNQRLPKYVLDVPFFLCAKDYAAQEQVKRLKIEFLRTNVVIRHYIFITTWLIRC